MLNLNIIPSYYLFLDIGAESHSYYTSCRELRFKSGRLLSDLLKNELMTYLKKAFENTIFLK